MKKKDLSINSLFFLLTLVLIYWYQYTSKIILIEKDRDKVPTEAFINLVSFGDEEFGYRFFALKFQFLGESYGKIKSLSKYNYENILEWVDVFDTKKVKSNLITSVLATYYAYSTKIEHRLLVIKKLLNMSSADKKDSWKNFLQSVYLFNSINRQKLGKSEDLNYIDVKNLIFKKFNNIQYTMPNWAKIITSLILSSEIKNSQDYCYVFNIIKYINKKDLIDISQDEIFGSFNYNDNISRNEETSNKKDSSQNAFLNIIFKRIDDIKENKYKYSCN